jgi:hypothetical protein
MEVIAAHGGEAEHAAEPQVAAVAAAEAVAEELPAIPAIDHAPKPPGEGAAVPISDAEWAQMEADLEPDPVVAWEAAYASEGPVPARASFI